MPRLKTDGLTKKFSEHIYRREIITCVDTAEIVVENYGDCRD